MNIVLFDGVCNFCNSSIRLIIKYDKSNKLKFSSLQSEYGKKALRSLGMDETALNTLVFINNSNQSFTASTAVLEIIKLLKGPPKLFLIFGILPRQMRDRLYRLLAKNRYKLFGKREQCMVPTPELKEKFLQ